MPTKESWYTSIDTSHAANISRLHGSYASEELIKQAEDGRDSNKALVAVLLVVAPIISIWVMIYAFQVFLYGLLQRFVESDNLYATYQLFGWSVALLVVSLLGCAMAISDEPPEAHITALFFFFVLLSLWAVTCWAVYKDYEEELDASLFGDFKNYLHRRYLLLKWRNADSGKTSLVETNWYRNMQ